MFQVTTFDTIIFIIYIVSVLVIGFYFGRKKHAHAADFFLARKSIPWYVVGFAMLATSISTEQFVGAGAKAYEVGMAVVNWEWCIVPAYTLLMFVFLPIYLRRKIFTIPEYLGIRYGSASRTIFSFITIASYFVINLAGVLYSGGYTFHIIFNIPLMTSIWLLAALTGVYTVYGGLSSVVWTEALQCVLLIVGGAFVVITGLLKIPGGLMAAVGTGERAHLILPYNHPELPWTAIIVLAFSTNLWYSCTNQFYIQSCLGAKNEWHARMGVVCAIFLGIVLGFTVEFSGVVGYRLVELGVIPAPPESNAIYPIMIRYLIPAGIRGIVFAGLVAAIMSSLSALINSIATLFSMDFYLKYIKPESSDKHLIIVGQITGTLLLITGTLWAPIVGTFPTIFDYFQQSWAIMAAPFAVVFFLGVIWKRANNIGAISTMILGIAAIPFSFWFKRNVLPEGFSFYN
ncbi:MAG TPA: hypothetical protein ENH82_10440, partial [bacterium]|nr:hypothetical protein [bacterium]